jgi:membrane associated rhomboid family serine protease
MVGASGSIYGLLAAYGYLFPNSYVNIYFFIPIKAKYFVILLMAISLFSGLSNQTGDNVAHFAHLGGAIVGLILIFGRSLFIRRRF